MNSYNIFKHSFLGNTVESYLWFVGILVFGLILKRLLSAQISRLIFVIFKRYGKSVGIQKFLQLMTRPIEVLFTLLIFYFAFDRLVFPSEWNLVPENQFGFRSVIFKFFEVALLLSLFWIILRTVDFIGLVLLQRAKKTETLSDDQIVTFAKEAVKVVIAGIGFFVILGVIFHLDVVSLLTGLGIGGLAIALAAKETLENLLGSFTIFLDKPFITGDTVKVGNIEGKVENVGFRSTRIRAVDRMIITVPNKKMIEADLINDTDRLVRRSAFTLSIDYETKEEQLRKILSDIRQLLVDHSLIESGSELVRFRNFGTAGLEILVSFIVLTSDMNEFLEIQEEINFQIMSILKKNNSSFAVSALYKSAPSADNSTGITPKILSSGEVKK